MGCCGTIIGGVIGVTKAVMRIERPDDAIIESRRVHCRACEHANKCPHAPSKVCVCRKCNCLIKAKTAVAGESCPAGRWPRTTKEMETTS